MSLPALLLLAYIVSFIQRQLPATLAQPIIAAFHLSDTDFGLLHGYGFAVLYALVAPFAGWLVDHASRIRLIAIGLALAGSANIVTAYAGGLPSLIAARLLIGAAQAALVPAAYSLLGQVLPRERIGIATAGFAVGPFLGAGLSLLCGGALARTGDWQTPFLVAGGAGLVLAWAISRMAEPDPPSRRAPYRRQRGEAWILMRRRWAQVLLLYAAMVLIAMAAHATLGWTVLWLMRTHRVDLTVATAALGLALLLGGLAGSLSTGWASDTLARRGVACSRLLFLALCATLAALVAAMLFAVRGSQPALGLLPVFAVPLAAAQTMGSAALQDVTPQPLRGIQHGCAVCLINLVGLGFGTLAIGVMSDRSGGSLGLILGLAVPALLAAAASAALLAIWAERRIARHDHAAMAPALPSSTA